MTLPETTPTITDAMVSALVRAFREHGRPVGDGVARVALTAALSVAGPGCSRCAELEAEVARLRAAAQAVVDADAGNDERLFDLIDRLRAVLESDGAPADRPAATEDER